MGVIDRAHYALSLDQIQTITKILEPDILESATLVNHEVFEKLKINVITDLENVHSYMVYNRHTGTTRRYVPGKSLNNDIGALSERELKVELAWNRITDNIQNYREKEPFSVLGTNESFTAPNSEWAIRQIAIIYQGDLLNCLFHGNSALGEDNALGLYDGFFTKINQDINAGLISTANGNLIEIDPIDGTDPVADYDAFISFYRALSPKLKAKEEIDILCSESARSFILRGYMLKYQGLQNVNVTDPGFRFFEAPKCVLMSDPALGDGDQLIATVPYNLEYGVDLKDPKNTHVEVGRAQEDFNVIIYQIQSAQGTRIKQISADCFATTTGKNTALESLGGEYQKANLTAGSNDTELGSVAISPEQDAYAKDDKVTLTATPESGAEFVKWSDGATINPRTIVFSGFPEAYQAIFKLAAQSDDQGGGSAEPTYTYTPVADTTGKNPQSEGWYERSGEEGSYTYTLTTDTTPDAQKTYYTRS